MLTFTHMTGPRWVKTPPFFHLMSVAWACGILALRLAMFAQEEKPPVEEFEAKAVLLYHFAKSTSWPEGTFKTEASPIIASVYGDRGFYEVLKKYHGRIVNGRALSIHYSEEIGQIPPPQILFFTGKMETAVAFYLKKNETPTLTVGETREFVEKGGILSVVRDGDHLTIYSNLKSAVETKLYLNNNLVKLTKQITTQTGEPSE